MRKRTMHTSTLSFLYTSQNHTETPAPKCVFHGILWLVVLYGEMTMTMEVKFASDASLGTVVVLLCNVSVHHVSTMMIFGTEVDLFLRVAMKTTSMSVNLFLLEEGTPQIRVDSLDAVSERDELLLTHEDDGVHLFDNKDLRVTHEKRKQFFRESIDFFRK